MKKKKASKTNKKANKKGASNKKMNSLWVKKYLKNSNKKDYSHADNCAAENFFQSIFLEMEKRLSKSYLQLEKDFLNKMPLDTLRKDSRELFVILGEMEYLKSECKRLNNKKAA